MGKIEDKLIILLEQRCHPHRGREDPAGIPGEPGRGRHADGVVSTTVFQAQPTPTPAANGQGAPPLAVEALKTTHRLIAAFDRDGKGLEWLHGDLYDSRAEVALSALDAVGVLANPGSFLHVTRLLAGGNQELRAAAVRALGNIHHPGSAKALVDLLKTTRGEGLRREITDALANAVPKGPAALGVRPPACACAPGVCRRAGARRRAASAPARRGSTG